MDTTVQHLEANGIPTGQIATIRLTITSGLCALWLARFNPDLLPILFAPEGRILLYRGLLNTISLFLAYQSFQYITISEFMTIFNLRPFPTGILCWYLFRERFTRIQLLAAIISFGAVILVVQPEFIYQAADMPPMTTKRMAGLIIAASMLVWAPLDVVLLKRIGDVNGVLILLAYAINGLIVGPLWVTITGSGIVWLSSTAWLAIIFISVAGLLAQATYVEALKRAEGVTIMVLGYFQIVFAVVLQVIVTRISPSASAILGMFIIIVAGVWCALKGQPEKEDADELPMGERRSHGYQPLTQDDSV